MIPSPTTMNRWKMVLPWLALGIYWPLIFVATHIPAARMPHMQIFGRDVTLHFTAYFVLTLLFWLARYRYLKPDWLRRTPYLVIAIIALYAAADEFLQMFVSRHADLIDWLADMVGCLIAMAILTLLRRCRYWLIAYGVLMILITHWPIRDSDFITLNTFWQQFQFCYTFTAYVILTLLFWRSICPQPRFMITPKIAITTLIVIALYALADETLSHWVGRGFDTQDIIAGLCGMLIGGICAATFAQHHRS